MVTLQGLVKKVSYSRITLLLVFGRTYWQGLISVYWQKFFCWHRWHYTAETVSFGLLWSERDQYKQKVAPCGINNRIFEAENSLKMLTQSLLLIRNGNGSQLTYSVKKKKALYSQLPKKALCKLFLYELQIYNSQTVRNTSNEQVDAYKY